MKENDNKPATDKKVVAAENECLRLLVIRLKQERSKYPDLLAAASKWQGLGSPQWTGGNYNTPEELATAAVAEAFELIDAMDTDFNASVRRIAEHAGIPYSKLLEFYTKHYILTDSTPEYCSYVPYNTLEQWRKKTEQERQQ